MTNIPKLTVIANGCSGIEIRAVVDYADTPRPVFISPWMQFEDAAHNDHRLQIAHEIVRRVLAHEALILQVTELQNMLAKHQDVINYKAITQETTYSMWRADRERAGFPADFSDIEEWPPEMMGDYRGLTFV